MIYLEEQRTENSHTLYFERRERLEMNSILSERTLDMFELIVAIDLAEFLSDRCRQMF